MRRAILRSWAGWPVSREFDPERKACRLLVRAYGVLCLPKNFRTPARADPVRQAQRSDRSRSSRLLAFELITFPWSTHLYLSLAGSRVSIRRQADAGTIAAERGNRIVEVVLAIEVRHVRSPQTSETRHILYGPFRKVSEYVTTQPPVDQVFRTSDRNACPRRKQIIGVSLLDDAWIMDLPDVTLRLVAQQRRNVMQASSTNWHTRLDAT